MNLWALLFLVLFTSFALAEDSFSEFVSITEEQLTLGKPYLEVTEKQLRRSPRQNVGEFLADLPGFVPLSSGPQGQLQSLSFRGANSEHLLVVVDGVVMNDLTSPAGAFDFSLIPLSLVQKIYVYKRGQAIRYGAGALAGVVEISLKTDQGLSSKFDLEAGIGSFDQKKLQLSRRALSLAWEKSGGFSSADESRGNREADGNESIAALYAEERSIRLEGKGKLLLLHQQKKTEYDAFEGYGGDDPNANTFSRQTLISIQEKLPNHNLGLSFRDLHRGENNAVDPLQSGTLQASYSMQRAEARFDTEISPISDFGVQVAEERILSSIDSSWSYEDYSFRQWQTAIWLENKVQTSSDRKAELSFRYDQLKAGGAVSAKASFEAMLGAWVASLELDQTQKFPSAFQQFSSFGDKNLQAEKSLGGNFSLGRNFEEMGFEIELFDRQFEQLIDFDLSTSVYKNLARVRTSGVTGLIKGEVSQVDWQASTTFLHAKDLNSGNWLLRRPFVGAQLELSYEYSDALSVQFRSRYLGERDDLVARVRRRVGSHTLSDLSFSRKWSASSLRLDLLNIFRERQARVWGYTEPDFHFNLGLQQSF
jgi:vitamin B12 transporter